MFFITLFILLFVTGPSIAVFPSAPSQNEVDPLPSAPLGHELDPNTLYPKLPSAPLENGGHPLPSYQEANKHPLPPSYSKAIGNEYPETQKPIPPSYEEAIKPDLYQVAIYHRPSSNYEISMPNCLGNLLTSNHVMTAASCFMNVKSIKEFSLKNFKKPTKKEEKKILFKSINSGIIDYVVVQVKILETANVHSASGEFSKSLAFITGPFHVI